MTGRDRVGAVGDEAGDTSLVGVGRSGSDGYVGEGEELADEGNIDLDDFDGHRSALRWLSL